MKTLIVTFLLLSIQLFGASKVVHLDKKYQNSKKCRACHMPIIRDWRKSWHAKSHYKKDEFFKKAVDFTAKKTLKSKNHVKVLCAKCHNPRIEVTKLNDDYDAIAALGLDKGTKTDKAIESDTIKEGINCLVCHNIDKIHDKAPISVRGMDRVEWTKNGWMSGPLGDAKSPYHKTQHRDFFNKNPNKLCFVCHAYGHSLTSNVAFGNMQKEYKSNQKCVDCHMGPKQKGVASTLPIDHGKPKSRMIRPHKFLGGHVEKMWKGALKLQLTKKRGKLKITLRNPQPHNIPSGCGSRSLLIEVKFYSGTKLLGTKTIELTQKFKRKKGRKSIPHIAIKATPNLSIPAKGSKTFLIPIADNSNNVEVTLYYRLVNDEVHDLLKLKDPLWSERFFIASKRLKL